MRTVHTGGIAGTDIAGGLPRVVELFEARSPKGKATLARTSGVVRVAEDEARGNWPYRYGVPIATSLSCDDAGLWEELPTGELVWRLRLTSPGARSLGLLFGEYELPAGGHLYVYDPKRTQVLGAFTNATRQPNGMLAVQPVLGDELTLEYVQDAGVSAKPHLTLTEVVHDYRGILDAVRVDAPQTLMAGCLVDVNCAQGAPYQDVKRAVVLVLFNGIYCSAGLLNDTAGDGTPYFLTANHCGNMTNGVAVFGYENPACGSGGASQANTISGATLLANSTQFDSQLYLLSAPPPSSFLPFYAGWDRSTNPPGPAISISHPSAQPKKIAGSGAAPTRNGTRFQAIWDYGKLEPGSSGSPLFCGTKRVIGPACCVSDFTCNGQWALYGRFGGFWQQQNLAQWLDPLNANPQTLDGLDLSPAQALPYNGSGVNPSIYASTTLPALGTTWQASIDTSSLPSTSTTWIFGHVAPSAGSFTPWGELLVTSTRLFVSIAPTGGGVSLHSNSIPNLPALAGQTAWTQGLLLGPGPLLLTNGVELRLK